MPALITELVPRRPRHAAALAPGAALVAAGRAATSAAEIDGRHYWLLASDGRRAYAQGRLGAGFGALTALRYRLARALATGERAWAARYRAAVADLEARAELAELRLLAAVDATERAQ